MKNKRAKFFAILMSLCLASSTVATTLSAASAAEIADVKPTESSTTSTISNLEETDAGKTDPPKEEEPSEELPNPDVPENPTEDPDSPEDQSGWRVVDGKTYYYDASGVPVTGWQTIASQTYYFDLQGVMQTGVQVIDNIQYYFSETGAMQTGWQDIGEKRYYYNPDGSLYTEMGFQKIGDETYYFNEDHSIQTQWKTIDGKTYYFARDVGILRTGFFTVNSKQYYADSNGALCEWTGWQIINGNKYYFTSDFSTQESWKTIDGKTYYFGISGVARTGWRNIDNKRYYFDKNGVLNEKTGFQKIGNNTYYFNADHAIQTQWKTISGKTYYFSRDVGILRTGFFTVNSKQYYADSKGVRYEKTGWRVINGNKYYFTKDYSTQEGWKTISGKTYYFGISGVARTGWRNIDNKKYYFDSNGVMQKSMWKTSNGYRYYLRSNGQAATGWVKIGTYRYYFNSNGTLDEDVRDRSDVKGPYRLIVSLKECTVLVVAKGTNGVYDIAAAKFVCSPGKASTPTPTGTYYAKKSARWQILMGPSWGQYGVHVVDGIYFHSIPCSQPNLYNIPTYDYYSLGTPASHGCIRLLVRDEKWIYDHAGGSGIRTTITNSDAKSVVSYLKKPTVPQLAAGQYWDPTDPIALKEQGRPTTKAAKNETLLSYKVTADVNYRSSASTSGTIKGALATGETIKVVKGYSKTANGYTWNKIKLGSNYYYVQSCYLKATSAKPETGTSGSTSTKETLVNYKTTAPLNYRSSPSTSGALKGTLVQGATVKVVNGYSKTSGGYKWYKIKIGSNYYYVASEYLKKA